MRWLSRFAVLGGVPICVATALSGGSLVASAATTAAPAVAASPASASPGSDIGNAGVLTGTGAGIITSSSDDWWVIYPSRSGQTVTVSVRNTANSGVSCGITATLRGTDGSSQFIDNTNVNPSASGQVTGQSAGSDRYYVEVTPNGCSSSAPYALTLKSGGGGTPPSPVKRSVSPGTGIGSAWPPLLGHSSYGASINFNGGTENWYVLYKKPDTHVASIRIENTTVSGSTSCAVFTANLFTNSGTGGFLTSTSLNNNAANTLSVPARQAGDPQGLLYLEVTADGFDCGTGGANYTIEPEPGIEFANPARVATGKSTPAQSIGGPWPPLHGGLSYRGSIDFSGGTENWYVLYKKPDTHVASIRVANTTVDGSTSCAVFTVSLFTNAGTNGGELASTALNNNAATTLSVPANQSGDPHGLFYLEITVDGFDCGTGGANYTIEPEPGAEFLSPAKVPAGKATPAPSPRRAWPPLAGGRSFKGSIDFSGGTQNWYVLDKRPSNHPGSVRVTNTTIDGSTSCAVFTVNLNTSTGLNLVSQPLNNNASATLSVPAHQAGDPQGLFFLEITADGFDCGTGGATYTIEPEPKAQFASPALKVASTTLKKGKVRRAYRAAIGVSEGRAPYSFVAKTKLPPGLRLNRRTGVISGRPTRRGRFSFKIEIIDSSRPRRKSVTDTFKITIT